MNRIQPLRGLGPSSASTLSPTGARPVHRGPWIVLAALVLLSGSAAAEALTVSSAVERALKTAPQHQAAQVAAGQAERSAKRARSTYLPRLDLRASYTRLSEIDQPPLNIGGTVIDSPFPQILDQYALKAGVTVPLSDYWLTIQPAIEALDGAADVARWREVAAQEATALGAQTAYFAHARSVASLRVADEAVAQLQAHVEALEGLLKAGQTTQAVVMQARAQWASAKAQRAEYQGRATSTAARLRSVAQLPPEHPISMAEITPVEANPATLQALQSQALGGRPEVKALTEVVRIHQRTARSKRGSRLPKLALVGHVDYANPNPRVIPQEDAFQATWDASVLLSWSPNDLFNASTEVQEATAQARRAEADLEALRRDINLQVQQAATAAEVSISTRLSTQESVDAARIAFEAQRDLFAAGEATTTDVLDAQNALRRAEFARVDAEIKAHLAQTQIQYAIGRAAAPVRR